MASSSDAFKVNSWVLLQSLTDADAQYNGQRAQITKTPTGEQEHYCVLTEERRRQLSVKPDNMQPIARDKLVHAVRLSCAGERSFIQPLVLPVGHHLLDDSPPAQGTCPVLHLIGQPIVMRKLPPSATLASNRAGLNNQWATWFMIDPISGLAPPDWLQAVGPVLLFRPTLQELTVEQVTRLNDFVFRLLDYYADGELIPEKHLTPRAFARMVAQMDGDEFESSDEE